MNLYGLHIEEMRREHEQGNLTDAEWDEIEQTGGERYGRVDNEIDSLRERLETRSYYMRKQDMLHLLVTLRMLRCLLWGSTITNEERRQGVQA